jgi:hypothetical protein
MPNERDVFYKDKTKPIRCITTGSRPAGRAGRRGETDIHIDIDIDIDIDTGEGCAHAAYLANTDTSTTSTGSLSHVHSHTTTPYLSRAMYVR